MSPNTPRPDAAQQISDSTVAVIAAEADAHPRSVVRRLAGLPVRGRSGVRIDRALVAHGLALRHPI